MRNLYSVPHADPIDSQDHRPETFGKGRRCLEVGCITRLCSYNRGPFCWLHAQRRETNERYLEVAGLPLHQRDLGEFLARAA